MGELHDCYEKVSGILGDDWTEPFESVELVEKYRRYWKPAKVKILLLGESHLLTNDKERSIEILRETPELDDLPDYPRQYVRFVYCLACGERNLTKNPNHPTRDGTPQFWKIFYSCDNRFSSRKDFFYPILLTQTNYEKRIQNKIGLLKSLRQKGIWLIDASIVGLYKKSKKPNRMKMIGAIEKSWENYTRSAVKDAKPEQVICIGKSIFDFLKSDLNSLVERVEWVYQPNFPMTTEARLENLRKVSQICCGNR